MVTRNEPHPQGKNTSPDAHSASRALDTRPCPCAEHCPNLPRLRRALWLLRQMALLIDEAHLDREKERELW